MNFKIQRLHFGPLNTDTGKTLLEVKNCYRENPAKPKTMPEVKHCWKDTPARGKNLLEGYP